MDIACKKIKNELYNQLGIFIKLPKMILSHL